MFGLPEKSLELIRDVLRSFEAVDKGIIFGSRAMNNNKKGSDVDIALTGNHIGWDITSRISGKLNEVLPLPYYFDVVDYTHLDNPELKEHIDRHGKVFYEKTGDAETRRRG